MVERMIMNYKYFFLIVQIVLGVSSTIYAMEAPQQGYPKNEQLESTLKDLETKIIPSLKSWTNQKEKRFVKKIAKEFTAQFHDVDSEFLKKALGYDSKKIIEYIKNLRILAQNLLFQHLFIQFNADVLCTMHHRDTMMFLLEKVGAGAGIVVKLRLGGFFVIPSKIKNPSCLAKTIRYGEVLNDQTKLFDAHSLSLIKTCLCSFQPEILLFGQIHKISRDLHLAVKKDEINKFFVGHFLRYINNEIIQKLPAEMQEVFNCTTDSYTHWVDWYHALKKQQADGTLNESKITPEDIVFKNNLHMLCLFYAGCHASHQKLYQLIVAELDKAIELVANQDLRNRLHTDKYKLSPAYVEIFDSQKITHLPQTLPDFVLLNKKILQELSIDEQLRNAQILVDELDEVQSPKIEVKLAAKLPEILDTRSDTSASVVLEKTEHVVAPLMPEIVETNDTIYFSNPKQGTKEYIFKIKPVSSLPKLPPFNYSLNVQQWLDDPSAALKMQGYYVPGNPRYKYRYECPWLPEVEHCFSTEIDKELHKWGEVTYVPNIKNKQRLDIHIKLPGMIIYPENMSGYPNGKKQKTGYFHYIIDQRNNECFHRFFVPMKPTEFIQRGWQNDALKNVEFPALPSTAKKN